MNPPTTTTARTETGRSRRARQRSWRNLAFTVPNDRADLLAAIRRLVYAHALDCGATETRADDIELCVSELLTNALRHTEGPARLEIAVHDGAVFLAVSDTSTRAPGPNPSANGENGRGLNIVRQLANEVGVRAYPWGKTISTSFRV